MAADEFHHQAELSLKREKRAYDFEDFFQAVVKTRNALVFKKMELSDFFKYEDCSSMYRLQKMSPRVHLSDMCQVSFRRGTKNTLFYKSDFESDVELTLDFLKVKVSKVGMPAPKYNTTLRGITQERKSHIIKQLLRLMPANRREFWENLPVYNDVVNLAQEDE